MTEAPENIWAITEPDDVSADILGDVYAQQVPDGMNGTPIKYIREDVALAMVAAVIEECLDRVKDSDPALSHTMRLETRSKADWQDAKAALDKLTDEAVDRAYDRALQAIADLPTGRTEDVMEGQEQAYRTIEAIRRGDDG